MQLSFHGAAGEVTGSSYLVETSRARVVVDFGAFQGTPDAENKNAAKPLFDPARLDAVVLTHAHIDHCGRLPRLYDLGCNAPLFATPATCDLTPIMLKDSAKMAAQDAAYATKKNLKRGGPPVDPLFDESDVERVLTAFRPVPFMKSQEIAPGIAIRFFDSGHILGSASIEMTVEDAGAKKVIVFSGDLGPRGTPIMNDPVTPPHADVVILESTYGDRDHRPLDSTVAELNAIIHDAVWRKERVMIPAFAVGRTQQMLYHLSELGAKAQIPDFPVYVDSPMAIAATNLYRKHQEILDHDARRALHHATINGSRPTFRFIESVDESKRLNDAVGAFVVIAGSGMCNGGRIQHHFLHGLWRRDAHVIIAGYQSEGTLGRKLVEGAKRVWMLGEDVDVRAQVHTLGGFSAHAGQSGLVEWIRNLATQTPRLFLTHGEAKGREALAAKLREQYGSESRLPQLGERVEL